MSFRNCSLVFLLSGLTVLSGCDFQAASDAFEDFDLVIGLESVNTVVNGTVVDNASGELLAARLTFSGEDASAVIDAFSDPVSELDAPSGIVTFGIQNSLVPTQSAPIQLTVTAEADGYYTSSRSISISETGDASFSVHLSPSGSTASMTGTASTRSQNIQLDATGRSTQTSEVSTGTSSTNTNASASFTLLQGTQPLAKDGTPLQGQITTELRVFDSAAGLGALPSGSLVGSGGANQSLAGATWFKMVDGSGRVAVTFLRSSGKTGKGAAACEDNGGTSMILRSPDPALVASVGSQASPTASIFAYTPADGQNNQIGTGIALTSNGSVVEASVCFGGTLANVSPDAIGDPSDGIIYTYSLSSQSGISGRMDHIVTLSNPAPAATQATFTLTGPGFQLVNARQVPAGSSSMSLATLMDNGAMFDVVDGASYVLSVRLPTGAVVSGPVAPSPLSGSSSLTLPPSSGLQTYSMVASMACASPATEKFEVRLTSESLDAVSAFFRVAGSADAWTLIRRSDITQKSATDSAVSISATLSLLPNTEYRFKGVLGNDDASVVATTPGSGTTYNVMLDPDDIGLSCVAR